MNIETYFMDYQRSFQLLLRRRTLWHLLIDASLLVLFFIIFFLALIVTNPLVAPFMKVVAPIQSQGAPDPSVLVAALADAGLSPTTMLFKVLTVYLVAFFLYAFLYAFLKLFIWESVLDERLPLRQQALIALASAAAWLVLLLLIYFSVRLSIFLGAATLILALILIIEVQPLIYARILTGELWSLLRIGAMTIIILITYIVTGLALSFLAARFSFIIFASPIVLFLFLAWGRSYVAAVMEVLE